MSSKLTVDPIRAKAIMMAFADPEGKNLMNVLSGQRILGDIGISEQGNQIIDPSSLRIPGPQGNILRGHEGYYPSAFFTLGVEGDVLLSQAM
jgi:hypothetical protein